MSGIKLHSAPRGCRCVRLHAGPCTCPHGALRELTIEKLALEALGV